MPLLKGGVLLFASSLCPGGNKWLSTGARVAWPLARPKIRLRRGVVPVGSSPQRACKRPTRLPSIKGGSVRFWIQKLITYNGGLGAAQGMKSPAPIGGLPRLGGRLLGPTTLEFPVFFLARVAGIFLGFPAHEGCLVGEGGPDSKSFFCLPADRAVEGPSAPAATPR